MTRAPVVRLPSAKRAVELKEWLANPKNFYSIASAFNSTSRFARLAEALSLAERNAREEVERRRSNMDVVTDDSEEQEDEVTHNAP